MGGTTHNYILVATINQTNKLLFNILPWFRETQKQIATHTALHCPSHSTPEKLGLQKFGGPLALPFYWYTRRNQNIALRRVPYFVYDRSKPNSKTRGSETIRFP